jgi:hypothetical protein
MRMARLNTHAQRLYADLGNLAESGVTEVGEPIADVYNTLLDQAKKSFPEDPLIETLVPATKSVSPRVLQALAGQLELVLLGSG